MIKPTRNPVTRTALQHGYPATDYSYKPDEWVYAPVKGRVVTADIAGDCGNRVIFESSTGKTKFYMCHAKSLPEKKVYRQADKLFVMGDTGYSFGRHLHLVIYVKKLGLWVRVLNPNRWLNKRLKAIREQKAVVRKAQAKLKRLEEC